MGVSSEQLFWIKIAFAAAVALVGLLGTLLPWILGDAAPASVSSP